jgi:hypothetical protein
MPLRSLRRFDMVSGSAGLQTGRSGMELVKCLRLCTSSNMC